MSKTAWIGLAKLLAVIAFAGTVLAAFKGYGHQQYQFGQQTERNSWVDRDNKELRTANDRIAKLQQEVRDKEHDHRKAMDGIAAQHQQDLKHVRTEKDSVISDLRSRNLRLRIPAVPTTSSACISSRAFSEADTGTCQCDGEETAELSGAAAEFLVGLASEADDVVWQLSACQAVVFADRKQQEGQ